MISDWVLARRAHGIARRLLFEQVTWHVRWLWLWLWLERMGGGRLERWLTGSCGTKSSKERLWIECTEPEDTVAEEIGQALGGKVLQLPFERVNPTSTVTSGRIGFHQLQKATLTPSESSQHDVIDTRV